MKGRGERSGRLEHVTRIAGGIPSASRVGYTRTWTVGCVWPGQDSLLEQAVRPRIVHALQECESGYADWMVTTHFRAERREHERLARSAASQRR